jgi:dUTP pyrophosphatase
MVPGIRICALPGGKLPERQTEGAIGYDVYLRAIVSPHKMDPKNSNLRLCLFDFQTPCSEDPEVSSHIVRADNQLVYRMEPHESVLAGIGFVTEMPYPMFYWVAPRSGLASKWGITVTNAPGTVDPDYRGEAGVLIYNRNPHTFDLRYEMRIAQIIFQWALIPAMEVVASPANLGTTNRGTGGFGSTGLG